VLARLDLLAEQVVGFARRQEATLAPRAWLLADVNGAG
jgi:hypothetical protein